jgi:hypothetical protein
VFTDKQRLTWRQHFAFSALFMYLYSVKQYNQILKTLHFSFNGRKYCTFIGDYFGWCKYGATGVDPGFRSVPLHRINSKLDFVSGQAVVGIRYMLPDEDSPLLFGID